jgi:hypothetical protein
MSTVDDMSFSYIYDLMQFYGIALMLLARMNCYGSGGMETLVFPA